MARDKSKYPLERILAAAERASDGDASATAALASGLSDADSAVRYWNATGLLIRGEPAARAARTELLKTLADPSPYVQVVAAEALARYGQENDAATARDRLVELCNGKQHDLFTALAALNAAEASLPRPSSQRQTISGFSGTLPAPHERYQSYVPRLLESVK